MKKVLLVLLSSAILLCLIATISYFIPNLVIKVLVLIPIVFGGVDLMRTYIVKK